MVWQGQGTRHQAIAVPGVSLAEGDVLVSVELATVCPLDAATVRGEREASVPLVLGHEQVGRIVALGDGAESSDGRRLFVGMRVVWSRTIGCGTCEQCTAGVTSRCRNLREYGADRLRRGWELSGGFATHVLVRAGTTVLVVPEIIPAAALAPASCATAQAAAEVEELLGARDVDGESVVVMGADLVGLTVAAMLADEGARVLIVEADRRRAARARSFGASAVAPDLAGVADLGGAPPVAIVALDRTARTEPRHLVTAVAFLSNAWYRYPFAELVGDRIPLARVDEALELAATSGVLRIGIEPTLR
jgi:D-arabinose 1-dehydrogenase-like Zn-dependent alcohol dehydrogenase